MAKSKSSKINANEHLSALLDSAFEFLNTAVDQFKVQPKYSVINFCSGVELILKARLLAEHWSLIVDEKRPNIQRFNDGDAKTLNFKDLIPQLNGVTGENISENIKNCFNNLASHRNRVIHFYHSAHSIYSSDMNSNKQLTKIAIEQSRSWYYLKLLLENWKDLFTDFSYNVCESDIADIDEKMQKHKEFLDAVFDEIKESIQNDIKKGIRYATCSSCGHLSSKEVSLTDNLFLNKCRVCSFQESNAFIKIPCTNEECNELIEITEANICNNCFTCDQCEEEIIKDYVVDLLNTEYLSPKEQLDYTPINCANCSLADSVIKHQDYLLCLECLFYTEYCEYCEYCGDGQIGAELSDTSFLDGCKFCDGRGYDD